VDAGVSHFIYVSSLNVVPPMRALPDAGTSHTPSQRSVMQRQSGAPSRPASECLVHRHCQLTVCARARV
jgi:hypothetical protein